MKGPEQVFWIASMPRSGSSWLSQVFEAHSRLRFRMAPLFSKEFGGLVTAESSSGEWSEFFRKVFHAESDFLCQSRRRSEGDFPETAGSGAGETSLLIKDVRNHETVWSIVEKADLPLSVIYLVRDPRAAISSWITNEKEFPEDADEQTWRTGGSRKASPSEYWGFDDWMEVTQRYCDLQNTFPERIKVVRYEDLCEGGEGAVETLFLDLGLNFEGECRKFLRNSWAIASSRPYSVYRDRNSVIDKWKTCLSSDIADEIFMDANSSGLGAFLSK